LFSLSLSLTIAGADKLGRIGKFAEDRREWLERFLVLFPSTANSFFWHDTFGESSRRSIGGQFKKGMLAWVQLLSFFFPFRGMLSQTSHPGKVEKEEMGPLPPSSFR